MGRVQQISEPIIAMCRLDTDEDMSLREAIACMDRSERDRMAKFVFERDQMRFARGRGFLRRELGKRLGLSPYSVPLALGRNGKPFVNGAPVAFNLSHSQDIAALVIREKGAVGVDIERLDRTFGTATDLMDLARRCFTETEQTALRACPKDTQHVRFLHFWTAKEARMKLWGAGMALDPKQISLDLREGIPTGYRNEPAIRLHVLSTEHQDVVFCYAVSDLADDLS